MSISGDGYFTKLHQYGAGSVLTHPPVVSRDPWPASQPGYYVATFTVSDGADFVKRNMSKARVPAGSIPIFAAILPQGSVLDQGALGAHFTNTAGGEQFIWFWMYGSNNIHDACVAATHEIVESIGADFGAPAELCDDCKTQNPGGREMDSGLGVETYFDAGSGTCVAPGSSWVPPRVGVGGGTSHGPALVVYRGQLFAAWKGVGDDTRTFWTTFDGEHWAPQSTENLGGGSSHGPALAEYGNQLFAAWKGVGDDTRMFWTTFDGERWAPQSTENIGGGSSHGPTLAKYDNLLYAAWKGVGEDSRLFWSTFGGDRWREQVMVSGASSGQRPALAAYQERLFATWKGVENDQQMYWSARS